MPNKYSMTQNRFTTPSAIHEWYKPGSKPNLHLILGGIPRSGTTAIARAISLLEGVFIWVGETDALNFFKKLIDFVAIMPVDKQNLELFISGWLRKSLIDMQQDQEGIFNLEAGYRVSYEDIDRLSKTASEIIYCLQERKDRFLMLANLLGNLIGNIKQARCIGEKSPNNVFIFKELSNLYNPVCVMTYRNPGEVLESMHARVGRDKFDSVFAVSRYELIGLYYRYAIELMDLPELGTHKAGRKLAYRVDYKRLMCDPVGVVANVAYLMGLDIRLSDLREVATKILGAPDYRPKSNHDLKFGKLNQIEYLFLQGVIEEFGYGNLYERLSDVGLQSKLTESVDILYGFYPGEQNLHPGEQNRWGSEEFSFIAVLRSESNLRLKFFNPLRRFFSSYSSSRCKIKCRSGIVGEIEISPKIEEDGEKIEFYFEFCQLIPLKEIGNYKIVHLTFQVTNWLIPFLTESLSSGDRRTLSLLYTGFEIVTRPAN